MSALESDFDSEPNHSMIRIDRAHPAGGSLVSQPAAAESVVVAELVAAGRSPTRSELQPDASIPDSDYTGALTESLHVQAEQLARHLQDRRREVDCRESQLNARIAQLEQELRLSRLWLQEQSQQFTEREADLRQLHLDQDARGSALAAAELALNEDRRQYAGETRRREELLARREFQVAESQQRLAAEASRLLAEREQLALERVRWEEERRHADSECTANVTQQRVHWQQETDALETDSLRRDREEWQRDRRHQAEAFAAEQEQFRLLQRRWSEERQQQQQLLDQERQRQNHCRATLDRIRAEILQVHRESLEMRLAAEQLWEQLTGRAAPESLAAGLTQLRSRIADEYRLATQELQAHQVALQSLASTLGEKKQGLTEQRRELLAWLSRRQRELAEQAHQLSQRERQLAANLAQLREQREQWQAERGLRPRAHLESASKCNNVPQLPG